MMPLFFSPQDHLLPQQFRIVPGTQIILMFVKEKVKSTAIPQHKSTKYHEKKVHAHTHINASKAIPHWKASMDIFEG